MSSKHHAQCMHSEEGPFVEVSQESEAEKQRRPKKPQQITSAEPPKLPRKKKQQSPQEALDEFWARVQTKHSGKVSTILPRDVYKKKVGKNAPRGTIEEENALASYDEAVRICKDKVEKIAKECRRINCKYSDSDFDIEFDLKRHKRDCLDGLGDLSCHDCDQKPLGPKSVKRVGDIFDDPKFYINGPTPNDVLQGHIGDCWLMAALCAMGNKPGLIEKICVIRDEDIGIYGFVFFRDGEWRPEIIDDKLYLKHADFDANAPGHSEVNKQRLIVQEENYRKMYQRNSEALYFAQCEDANETWLPLLEKAYAKAHGDFAAMSGGQEGEAIEDLTGSVATEVLPTDIFDKNNFWNECLLKVNEDFLITCAVVFRADVHRSGIVRNHSYSIHRALVVDGHRLLLLRNPWGCFEWDGPWSDGSKEWTPELMKRLGHRFGDDGEFWISYESFLQRFSSIQCVRLLSSEFEATQKWISLNVPFVYDYHKTKFVFTLEKASPVVLVLSQLDNRYFQGLQGKYKFELSFSVQKSGEQDYAVSSQQNTCLGRSVCADLTLEAGEYYVVMKIRATNSYFPSVLEVVKFNTEFRLPKLMQIGLNYDMGHAKVREEDKLEERRVKKRAERIKLNKLKKKLREKMMKSKKRKRHVENKEKRKKRAAKVKKLAKAKAKAEKAAQEKAKLAEITGKVDAASQTSEKTTPKPPDAKDPAPAAQSIAVPETEACITLTPTPTITAKLSPEIVVPEADDDDDSDLDSVVSDVSSGTIDEKIEEVKMQMTAKPAQPVTPSGEEDNVEQGYWNPVVVVGLRVYSKESGVTIKVVRPHDPVLNEKSTVDDLLTEEVARRLEEVAKEALLLVDDGKKGGGGA